MREKAYLRKNPIRNFTMQREVRKLIIADITEAEIQQLFQEPPEPSFEGFRNRLILEFFMDSVSRQVNKFESTRFNWTK